MAVHRLSPVRAVLFALLVFSLHQADALAQTGAQGETETPAKFCLFSFGLSKTEKAYIRGLILARDSSRESRRYIWGEIGRFCIGADEFQAISSCISFQPDLHDCLYF